MLRLGGYVPCSSVDYPDKLAAVVFCRGCAWNCAYCQNAHLRPAAFPAEMGWQEVRDALERRRGLLDAVVFSGGEPLLQAGVVQAAQEARDMGFLVGLHTAGSSPDRLRRLLPLVDWVGLDIKAPWRKYDALTGIPGSAAKAEASARMLLASGVACEFRTTVHPSLLNQADLAEMADWLSSQGARHYVLQACRPAGNACSLPVVPAGYLRNSGVAILEDRFERFEVRE